MKMYLIILLMNPLWALYAQSRAMIDTSYTIHSEFNKRIKKFPFIEIKRPETYATVNVVTDLVYDQLEDRNLHLDAYYNNQNNSNPVVLLIHGGGWKSGNKSLMVPLAQDIASKGYACFAVEYRLSTEIQYPASVQDVKQAIHYVKTHASAYNADSSRVAILGCSSGGQIAALVGTTDGNKRFERTGALNTSTSNVQAIIDLDGVLAFHHPLSEEGTAAAQWLGGTYDEIPEVWEEASALNHTDENTPPVLFINSQYPRFHAGRDEMMELLSSYGIYNQAETIEGSPHTFWLFNPWYDTTLTYITNFLTTVFN